MSIASQLNTFVPTVNTSHIVSFIYDNNKAKFIDRYTLHRGALDSLNHLFKNHELLSEWKASLFGDESEQCNRDMLTDTQNKELSKKISNFLPYLSQHFLNPECGPIIEYMIRVYSINILGANELILSFLSHYQNPLFIRLLSLCKPTIFTNFINLDRISRRDFVIHLTQFPTTLSALINFYIDHPILIHNARYSTFICTLLISIAQQQIISEVVLTTLLSVVLQLIKSDSPKLTVVALSLSSQILSLYGTFIPERDNVLQTLYILDLYLKYFSNLEELFILKDIYESIGSKLESTLSKTDITFSELNSLYNTIIIIFGQYMEVTKLKELECGKKSCEFLLSVLLSLYRQNPTIRIKTSMIEILVLLFDTIQFKNLGYKNNISYNEMLTNILIDSLKEQSNYSSCIISLFVELVQGDCFQYIEYLKLLPFNIALNSYNKSEKTKEETLKGLIGTTHYISFLNTIKSNLSEKEKTVIIQQHFIYVIKELMKESSKERMYGFDCLNEIGKLAKGYKENNIIISGNKTLKFEYYLNYITAVQQSKIELTSSSNFITTFNNVYLNKINEKHRGLFVDHVIDVINKDHLLPSQEKMNVLMSFGMRSVDNIVGIMKMLNDSDELYDSHFEQKVLSEVIKSIVQIKYVGAFVGNKQLFDTFKEIIQMSNGENVVLICSLMNEEMWGMMDDIHQEELLRILAVEHKDKRSQVINKLNRMLKITPFDLVNKIVMKIITMINTKEPIQNKQLKKVPSIVIETTSINENNEKKMEEEIIENDNQGKEDKVIMNELQFMVFVFESFFKVHKGSLNNINFEDNEFNKTFSESIKNISQLIQITIKLPQCYHTDYLINIEMNSLIYTVGFVSKYLTFISTAKPIEQPRKKGVIIVRSKHDTFQNKIKKMTEDLASSIQVLTVIDVIYEVIETFGMTPAIYNGAITVLSQMIALFPTLFVEHSDRFVRALSKEEIVGIVVQKLIPHVISSISSAQGLPATSIVELLSMIVDNYNQLPYHRRREIFLQLFKESKLSEEHLSGVIVLLIENEADNVLPFVYDVFRELNNDKVIKLLACIIEDSCQLLQDNREGVFAGYQLKITKKKEVAHLCIDFVNGQITKREFIAKCMKTTEDVNIQQSYTILFKQVIEMLNKFDCTDENDSNTIFADKLHDMVDNISDLFSITTLIRAVVFLLKQSSIRVKRTALLILNQKLTALTPEEMSMYEASFLNAENGLIHVVIKILENVDKLNPSSVDNDAEQATIQTGVLLLEILLRFYGAQHTSIFMDLLNYVLKCIQIKNTLKNIKIVASALLCLSIYAAELKTSLMPQLPQLIPMFFDLLPHGGDEDSVNSLINSVISCMMSFTKSYGNIVHPYINSFIPLILDSEYTSNPIVYPFIMEFMGVVGSSIEFRLVMSLVSSNFKNKKLQNDTSLAALFGLLSKSLNENQTSISQMRVKLYQFLFEALKTVPKISSPLNMKHCNDELIGVFNSLVLKLSDDTFKPFFLKCAEGFNEVVGTSEIPSIYIYTKIILSFSKTLKSLFVPYYAFVLKSILTILNQLPLSLANALVPERSTLGKRSANNIKKGDNAIVLLDSIYLNIELLQTLFQNDNSNFVDSQKVEQLLPTVNLIDLMHNCYKEEDDYFDFITKRLSPCLCQFALCVPNQVCWKPLNHQLLIQTQHTDSIVRLAALHCMIHLWDTIAADIVYLLPETLPYLTDLMEDTNQEVVEAAKEFAQIVQKHLGADSLQKYLN
ncbi:bap28, putative [Entamoeba dispar SAW760]|uniref:HEAT repeat-containing protein 1 n=1 Tax=Entamoeba dispar (strain ATCC PRA-260 / SAW760) TaxID=370354 RepID=B0EUJ7_ENTDS|nr:bap28, putative [Entamoeba dispar SAW760]EDR21803.1 bap28, putative [Entamoeba dispar SAW760]|eukprot:EDR21803.1 bap28, putative [Entamoeba dispar SAW760]